MFNFKTVPSVVNITVNAAYTAGTPYQIADDFIGVCHQNLAAGETGAFMVEGVFSATADGAIAIGDQLYLSGSEVGTVSSAGLACGKAYSVAADGGEVLVALNK